MGDFIMGDFIMDEVSKKILMTVGIKFNTEIDLDNHLILMP